MTKISKKWKVAGVGKDILTVLLRNRNIADEKEFFYPPKPVDLTLHELGIKKQALENVSKRIEEAKKGKERAVIYGDYDADGVCATAVLWESLHKLGIDVLPYLPERFSEGYGINITSVKKLKATYPDLKLIITVDNGIVANKDIAAIKKIGIDVVVLDHHQPGKTLPKASGIVHTTKICATAIAWIIGGRRLDALDLVGIATIADQVPLTGPNRSFAKYGLEALRRTDRPGLMALYKEAKIIPEAVGTYTVGFLIAPRINAMGRLEHAIDSLRLLCTTREEKAEELARQIGKINAERQKIVDEVVTHAYQTIEENTLQKVIILSNASYHEGVIGLAAAKLVEKFYRPAIVIAEGCELSKASARSVAGFNIIETIKQFDNLLENGGGHPMAAGFSIKTANILQFVQKFTSAAEKLLTEENLYPILKIDMDINFKQITSSLVEKLKQFEPSGMGNPTPLFLTKGVEVLEAKTVGADRKHLKLVLKNNGIVFEAIAFGFGDQFDKVTSCQLIDVVYSLEENVWNGVKSVQLKVKDFI